MIELDHLVKRFGELTAVNDLSLTIPRGEFFAVLGPNAAGKTTTIKMLTGLIKPTSGIARIGGYDVQEHPLEARRRLAYVPDFPFLYDKLTAHVSASRLWRRCSTILKCLSSTNRWSVSIRITPAW
jgi:ABC-2 type transport system ATP-binding protein